MKGKKNSEKNLSPRWDSKKILKKIELEKNVIMLKKTFSPKKPLS